MTHANPTGRRCKPPSFIDKFDQFVAFNRKLEMAGRITYKRVAGRAPLALMSPPMGYRVMSDRIG
jgi:hypothetical protein